jgi:hypothetical protein
MADRSNDNPPDPAQMSLGGISGEEGEHVEPRSPPLDRAD